MLVTLDVRGNEGALDAEGALQPLEPLAASLRHLGLSECNMARLPRQLSALSGLQSLVSGWLGCYHRATSVRHSLQ